MQFERYSRDRLKEISYISLLIVDIMGNIRNICLPAGRFDDILKNGARFDASAFGYAEPGEPEMTAVIAGSAAFIETRENSRILYVLCDVLTADGEPLELYPRNVIKNAKDFIIKEKIVDSAKIQAALEYYVFDEAEYGADECGSSCRVSPPEGFAGCSGSMGGRPGRAYVKMHQEDCLADLSGEAAGLLSAVGIPVRYFHNDGLFPRAEIELDFMDIVQASDMISLSKWIICRAASESGFRATFMPKPLCGAPGNALLVRQLLEKDGLPLFSGDTFLDLSEAGLSYAAGLLSHSLTGSLLAFACPGANSYRRLVQDGGAPVRAAFSKDSRTSAVRIMDSPSDENAVLGYLTGDASGNIYFFLSALLLAGADGLLKGMNPVWLGYHSDEAKKELIFPLDLNAVLDGLEKDADYLAPAFPDKLTELWIKAKRAEAQYVYSAPTPQEYELYF